MAPEIAHFRPDDAGCFVAASLACPLCLSSSFDFELAHREADDDPVCRCRCRTCGHGREVFLTLEQALRLSLHEQCPLDLTPRSQAALLPG